MAGVLPSFFMISSGLALVAAIFTFWRSIRGAFGGGMQELPSSAFVSPERQAILDEKEALLRGIKELAFERDAGKISDDDFSRLDAGMRTRAREVLKALDAQVEPFRDDAERLIADHLGGRGPEVPTETAQDATTRDCPGCGTQNDDDAAFCKRCGKGLGDDKGDDEE